MAGHERNGEQFVPYIDHDIASQHVKAVSFRVYNDIELKKLCVKQLHDTETFDCLGHATSGGLYDLELGIYVFLELKLMRSVSCFESPIQNSFYRVTLW